jgi:hypothetical protein
MIIGTKKKMPAGNNSFYAIVAEGIDLNKISLISFRTVVRR